MKVPFVRRNITALQHFGHRSAALASSARREGGLLSPLVALGRRLWPALAAMRRWSSILAAAFNQFEGEAAGQRLGGDQADLDAVAQAIDLPPAAADQGVA